MGQILGNHFWVSYGSVKAIRHNWVKKRRWWTAYSLLIFIYYNVRYTGINDDITNEIELRVEQANE